MAFNLEQARQNPNYDPAQTLEFLSKAIGFDLDSARQQSGFDENATIEFLASKAKAQPSENVLAWKDVASQALTNVPESASEFGKALLTVIRHPIETGKGIMNLAIGVGQKVLPEDIRIFPEEQKQAETVGQFFADRYGGVENLKQTIAKDPVGFLADASVVLGGAGAVIRGAGTAGKVGAVSKAGQVVGRVGRTLNPVELALKPIKASAKLTGRVSAEVAGVTTGTGFGAIKEAFIGGKEFRQAMRGQVSGQNILNDAKNALYTMKDNRANQYMGSLKKLKNANVQLDMKPVLDRLNRLKKTFNIGEGKDAFKFSSLDKEAHVPIKNLIDLVEEWGADPTRRTPVMLDILKQRIDDFFVPTKNSRAFVTPLRNEVRGLISKNVKGYSEMTKSYRESTVLIEEIEKTFGVIDKPGKADTAIKKLTGALRDNNEYRKAVVDSLEIHGGKELTNQIAGLSLSTAIPRGLLGRVIAGVGAISGGFLDPSFLGILVAGSPRIVGEFVNALGRAIRIERKISGVAIPAAPAAFQAGRGQQLTQEQIQQLKGIETRGIQ